MSDGCNCTCRCPLPRTPDCNDLCDDCWRAWCVGSKEHQPIADRSYMGVYGITSPWVGWLIGRAPELIAEPAGFLQHTEVAPGCPGPYCAQRMVRRPGAWKCYQHDPPHVIRVPIHFPGTPKAKVRLLEEVPTD